MISVLVVCPNPAIDIFAWIDTFELGVPNRIQKEKRYPGGKGLHVAMALSELGIPVTVAGVWGGEAGIWLQRACNEYYPDIKFIGPVVDDWTRSCYTYKSADKFDDTEILGTGPTLSKKHFDILYSAVADQLQLVEMIAMCGSWPQGSPEDGYAQLIELAKTENIPTIIDCTGIQLKNALKAQPFGVHLNRKEITSYFNLDFEQSKKKILEYTNLAAITDGSKGLYLMNKKEEYHALCSIEKVISTIGSGDCLTAGVVAGIVQTLPLSEVAQLGAACGAANCLREDLGMLSKTDVDHLLTQFN